jgi:putative membrane protein (TIGR04086 family)
MTERKNGWLAGLSSALIIIIATLFINILIKTPINLLFFIKVISYIISGIVGGMIGVNFKK